jgi:hypothetical protein
VTALSKEWACGLSRLRVRISPGAWVSFFCECCVLSGTGLCDGLVTRPEKSYRVWVWCEASVMRRPWPTRGSSAIGKKLKETLWRRIRITSNISTSLLARSWLVCLLGVYRSCWVNDITFWCFLLHPNRSQETEVKINVYISNFGYRFPSYETL